MGKYKFVLKLQSPLTISQDRQGYLAESLNYIPGSTLRGAVAHALLREQIMDAEDNRFQKLFLQDEICFPHLHPVADANTTLLYPAPLTSMACKRFPEEHPYKDTLFERTISSCHPEQSLAPKPCVECGQDLKAWEPLVDGYEREQTKTGQHIQMHVGIDPITETAAEGILFGQTALNQGTSFAGLIDLDDASLASLEPLKETGLVLGKSKTRGYGEAWFDLIPVVASTAPDLDTWSQQFKQFYAQLTNQQAPQGTFFSLNLLSDTLWVDRFLRPSDKIEAALPFTSKRWFQMVRPKRIRGWQSAWGLPKQDELAIAAGSVFLFHTAASPAEIQPVLESMRNKGLGLRRSEGFGNLSYCLPWHLRR